jgi:hypothetical protein
MLARAVEAQESSPAAQASPAPLPAAQHSEREARLWKRLRQVQSAIPAGRATEVPFASVEVADSPSAIITQINEMGGSFRLTEVSYQIDGHPLQIGTALETLQRRDATLFEGRMRPGRHELRIQATIRGHGYGVFSYMKGYRLRLSAAQTFEVRRGARSHLIVRVKEDASAPIRQRFSIAFDLGTRPLPAKGLSGTRSARIAPVAPSTIAHR